VLAALIVYEAIHRLVSPPAVQGWTVLIVALAGVGVKLLATWQLAKANRENMAVEGSFQHIITDLYAFIATVIAGIVILTTGFGRADPIASLVVAALMLRASYGLLKDSGRVLLEMSPQGMSAEEVGRALANHPHVTSVHDLHVWEIGSGFPRCRPTSSCIRETTVTRSAESLRGCSTSASGSTTPHCRSITRPSRSFRSRRAPDLRPSGAARSGGAG
jgi:cation diffusion facilitator family transporter